MKKLAIEAIEKFNPNDPNLATNVKSRIAELRENREEIGAFYDKSTGKIFINESLSEEKDKSINSKRMEDKTA